MGLEGLDRCVKDTLMTCDVPALCHGKRSKMSSAVFYILLPTGSEEREVLGVFLLQYFPLVSINAKYCTAMSIYTHICAIFSLRCFLSLLLNYIYIVE